MNARDDRRHISCCGQGKQGIQGVAGRTPGWPPPWPGPRRSSAARASRPPRSGDTRSFIVAGMCVWRGCCVAPAIGILNETCTMLQQSHVV